MHRISLFRALFLEFLELRQSDGLNSSRVKSRLEFIFKSMTQCPHCGSNDIDEDAGRGEATCMDCGTVLEESTIVSEVQFQETAGGGSGLIGQFVAQDRPQPNTLQGVRGLVSQESREVTYFKGKKKILEVASQLHINQHCIDTAYNFFKMCVCRNLTRGRQRGHVVAACLYMTCRLENTPHLLLDFSDKTQVNVYDLGRTLNFLARTLHINLPNTDPCLYILRFALMLDFGDKQREVVSLATRIVQRMKRDWLSTGRRPTGICGAALLLAARCYNFNRSISDIVRVVHISESVVRKRLDEFSRTPSANVTIDEFNSIDLEQSEDPPAYREARRKAREKQKHDEEQKCQNAEREMHEVEEKLEQALEVKHRETLEHLNGGEASSSRKRTLSKSDAEDQQTAALVQNEMVDFVYQCAVEEAGRSTITSDPNLPVEVDVVDPPVEVDGDSPPEEVDVDSPPPEVIRPPVKVIYRPTKQAKPEASHARPSIYSLGIRRQTAPEFCAPLCYQDREHSDGELDLTGIDDREIDTYLLTEGESKLKEKYWMKMNGEHMALMEQRKKEKLEKQAQDPDQPKPKRRIVRKKNAIVANTAQEAMEKVIIEKKLSSKINFDVLKTMETE
ncbi:hypothetical protein L596_002329 [Steinernema carpocapsae]|uniref:B-related factor 1 n=1 Tax=Steinernema carpocapsae TaxID=34508 RepID=A0A4U8UP72_STECR|nr:hypothetical protein L596_002329 [Steinernema carpocapsae]